MYAVFQAKLEDIKCTQKSIDNMRQIPAAIWGQICAVMGITDSADDTAVVATIKRIVEKAGKYDQASASLIAKEKEVEDIKKAAVATEVNGMISAALGAKKITAKQKEIFAKQYAEDPEALKEVLDSMGAFVSVASHLTQSERGNGSFAPEVKALMAEGWDKLDKSGRLADLKALDENGFLALYKNKFGYLPNEKPLPFMPGNKR
jgi:vacuolar-type H+-ATPase subunit I/STV1